MTKNSIRTTMSTKVAVNSIRFLWLLCNTNHARVFISATLNTTLNPLNL